MKASKVLGLAAMVAAMAAGLSAQAETYSVSTSEELTAAFDKVYAKAVQRRAAVRGGRRTLLAATDPIDLDDNVVLSNDVQVAAGYCWKGLPDGMDLVVDLNGHTLFGADGVANRSYGYPAFWVDAGAEFETDDAGGGGRITIKDTKGGGMVRGGHGWWHTKDAEDEKDEDYAESGAPAILVWGTNATFVVSGNLTVVGGNGSDDGNANGKAGSGAAAVYVEGGTVTVELKDGATLVGGNGGNAANGTAGSGGDGVDALTTEEDGIPGYATIKMDEGTNIRGGQAGTGVTAGYDGELRYAEEETDCKVTFQTFGYTFKLYDGAADRLAQDEYWEDMTAKVTAATNPVPTRVGYGFKEWQLDGAAVADFAVYKTAMPSTNITFQAAWTAVVYTVAYELDGGSNASGNPATYTIESAKITLADATRTGHTFSGWSKGGTLANGGTKVTEIAAGSTGDLTLYANWDAISYTVAFVSDGLTLEEQSLPYGATITYNGKVPTRAADEKATYRFTGWSPEFTSGVTTMSAGDVTYTAQFEAVAAKTYTITWNVEGTTTAESYAYGETPSYKGAAPTRAAADGITWTWNRDDGWTPAVAEVTGEATYTAKFTPKAADPANYKVIVWYDWDDTVLKTETIPRTDTPDFGGVPTRASDAEHDYVFQTWENLSMGGENSVHGYRAVYSWTKRHYSVTWDVDGVLTAQDAEYGTVPDNASINKEKAGYTFAGWVPTVAAVTNDVTYVAQFTARADPSGTPPKPYVVTFYDDDKATVLKSEAVEANAALVPPADPVKAATEAEVSVFAGWSDGTAVVDLTGATVTGDATYYATYTSAARTYTVTWVVGDRVETETYAYGWTPSYEGRTDKADDDDFTYTFSGWTPEIAKVTGDATYEAQYTAASKRTGETPALYAVTWLDDDGTVLKRELVESGDRPDFGGTPLKAATDEYAYAFAGWNPAIKTTTTLTADATYTATYAATTRRYDITWVVGDEATVTTVEYGRTPVYTGETNKAATATLAYVFQGWTPAVAPVTGEATYEAVYKAVPVDGANYFAVTWLDADGATIREDLVAKSSPTVTPPADPVKAATAAETFAFAGWRDENGAVRTFSGAVTVSDNAVYTATFAKTARPYAITWVVDGDSTVAEAAYGTTPAYPKATPTADGKVFAGWYPQVEAVSGEATYTAQFTAKGDPANERYVVTFKDDDGRILASDVYAKGATPQAPADPVKAATEAVVYAFSAWTPEVAAVTEDATYTAVYAATRRTYTVTWDVDGATSVTTVEYGATPVYYGATPTRAADAARGLAYTFAGWTPDVAAATNDATYEAVFTGTSTKSGFFAITWLDDDGAELGVTSVAKDAEPTFPDPAKAATDEFDYAFAGWTPDVAAATADATYRATYARTRRVYTVTWNVEGTKTTTQAEYGATPAYPDGTPVKAATADFTYAFAGWAPQVEAVTGEAAYTAMFDAKAVDAANKVAITWRNDDGTTLKTDLVAKSATEKPVYTGATPVKAGTDGATYTFAGWTPEVAAATADATYTATYTSSPVLHTITWVVEGATTATQVAHGATPAWTGATPEKAGCVFDDWAPTVVAAEADATYTAQFKAVANPSGDPAKPYVISFYDEDGTLLDSQAYAESAVVTAPATGKVSTDEFDYTFAEWTPAFTNRAVKTVDYTAVYAATRRTYTVTWDVDGVKTADSVEYGKTPFFAGAEPTKSGYTFIGWNPDVAAVTGDALYTAKFAAGEAPKDDEVRVVWEDGDGNVLASANVAKGSTPTAPAGLGPTKEATAEWVYTWDGGWTPAVGPVTKDTTYTATFTAAKRTYAVTWIVEGRAYADTSEYGAVPVFDEAAFGVTLATAKTGHDFSNWVPIPEATTNDATYTAQFTAKTTSTAPYVVTFYDDDGRVIQTKAYTEAEVEPFSAFRDYPADPVKAATEAESYTFAGWAETVVTDDAYHIDLVATYAAVARTYAVTWVVAGVSTNVETYAYGAMPAYPDATPVKAGYRFKNWAPTLAAVTGDITYTAQFEPYAANKYTVTFEDEDGTILQTGTYTKDTGVVTPPADPVKDATDEFSYTFAQWTPAFTNRAVADATYTAVYAATRRTYAVTWQVEGREDETVQVAYGTTPTHADPTPATGYTFAGWVPAPVAVTGAVTYVAQFKAEEAPGSTIVVTFYDDDGTTILSSKAYDKGMAATAVTVPAAPDPSARDTAQYKYTFGGWSPAVPREGNLMESWDFRATYTVAARTYTITWHVDGETSTSEVAYGETPAYSGTPAKADGTFEGWSPSLAPATADAAYTAVFKAVPSGDKTCIISFFNDDGTPLGDSRAYAPGETVEEPETPAKAASASNSYVFNGWTPAFSRTAEASVDYVATYATVPHVEIAFANDDGTVLQKGLVPYGERPAYAGDEPTKAADADFTYTFRDWAPVLVPATQAATYTAQFSATATPEKKAEGYVAVTWVDGDGATIGGASVLVAVGDEPEAPVATKTEDADFIYTFTGWTPAVGKVYEDTVYTAQFRAVSKKTNPPAGEDKYYAVTWQNWDGETLRFDAVKEGGAPVWGAEAPARPADAAATGYTFAGWTRNGAAVTLESETVTADTVYTAAYEAVAAETYTITWKVVDQTTEESYSYGATPSYTGSTARAPTADFTYTFKGWLPAVVQVTGEATYTADYEATSAKPGYFAVKWVDWDGTELDVTSVSLGEAPVYTKVNPTRDEDAENTYAFAGWDPSTNGVAIAADTTFTAQYTATTKKGGYITVTWKNADGTILKTESVRKATDSTAPTAEMEATAEFAYTFTGWSEGVDDGRGNITYTARYNQTTRTYDVTWMNGAAVHGGPDKVAYGTVPTKPATNPEKGDDDDYTYTFRDWAPEVAAVVSNTTYAAQYTATLKGSDKPDSPNYGYYAVTWIGGAGETLDITKVARGDAPVYTNTTPTKADGEFEAYTFTGWEPTTNTAVTADATFTAQFAATSKKGGSWAVRFVDWDGTELTNAVLATGTVIVAPAEPSRSEDAAASYTFKEWVDAADETKVFAKNTTKATKDVTYVATYTESAKEYTVAWKVDGQDDVTAQVAYGKAPTGAPASPTKAEDDNYTYTFRDWAPSTNTVITAAATFVAQFDATLKGGDPTDPKDPKFGKVAVTWVDGDGATLYTDTVDYGSAPAYDKAKNTGDRKDKEPTKADGELVTYTFREWSPATNDVELVEDTTFTAQFDAKSRKGGSWAVTWVVDGVSVRTDIVKDGGKPDAAGVDTTKAADAQYTYAFKGWTKDGTTVVTLADETVKANTTYTAKFEGTAVATYTVTWLGDAGAELHKDENLAYGAAVPAYTGATPTKAEDDKYTYTFREWSPATNTTVTANLAFTAQFDKTAKPTDKPEDPTFGRFTITWADGDGKTIKTDDVPMGDDPTPPDPSEVEIKKTATADIAYVFNDTWLPEIVPATTSATYTAQFDAVSRKPGSWAVRFVDWDGTELQSGLVKENETIAAPATNPTREADAAASYTFKNWVNATNATEVLEKDTTKATKDVTYVATYEATAKEYTVTWKVGGQADETVQVAYGAAPTGAPADPTKAADTTYTYTFRDWAPTTNTVITAEATFVAQFDAALNHSATPDPNVGFVAVEWIDGDGKTLDLRRVSRGTAPVYTGTTPTKAEDDKYTYTFREWSPTTNNVELVEDATFTAQFDAKAKKGGSWAVTWVVENKTVRTDTVANGAAPVWNAADPTKAEDANGTYRFKGWSRDGTTTVDLATEKVTANTTYTALFELASATTYTVTWLNGDETELQKDENLSHGTAVPAYTGTTPTKADADGYTYTFRGWSPSTNTTVTTDLTFRPQFNATLIRPTDPTDPKDPAFGKVAVTWVDGDGETLYTEAVPLGDTPAYDNTKNEGDKQGKNPTKASGDNIAYTFADAWLPELAPATTDAVYTAVFTATSQRSDSWAVCFVDWDGTELSRATVLKDAAITAPDDPTRAGDDKATAYAFDKWVDVANESNVFAAGTTTATKDVTYKAVYKVQTAATYTITWKVDGLADETTQEAYGTTPTHAVATKAKADGITYTFTGWAPTPVPVTGEATYTAKFSAELDPADSGNEGYVLVSWVDGDGATLDTEKIPLGSTTTYKGATEPTKTEEALVRFTFTGWLPDTNTTVMAATTYTAQFDAVSKTAGSVAVRFVDWDGTEITNQVVKTGTTITPPTNPTRADDARVAAYDFDKWVEATTGAAFSATATADITYKATYTETLKTFTVTWLNDDGTELHKDANVEYGAAVPAYDGAVPSKANANGYTYTFRDWSPATNTTVTADTTFTAQFDAALDPTDSSNEGKVAVTWVNGDGSTLGEPDLVTKGDTPVFSETAKGTPTKAEDTFFTYIWNAVDGWTPEVGAVTTDTVYTAKFTAKSKSAGSWAISWKGWDGADLGTTLVKNGTAWAAVEKATAPDRTGYSFKEWQDGTGAEPTTITADVTVTATYDKHGTPDDPVVFPLPGDDPVPDPSDFPYAEYVKLTGDVTNLVFAATVTNLVIDLNGYGIYGTNGVAGVGGGDALTLRATEGVFVLTNSQTTVSLVKGGTGGDGTAAHTDGYNGGTGIKTAFGPNATLTVRERITVAGGDAGKPYDGTGKPGEPGPGTDAPKADGLAYELRLVYNDGTTPDGVSTNKYGDTVTAPTAPAWYGHSLEGWYDNDAGAAKVDFAAGYTMPARDTVLAANWTNNLYLVRFVNDDASATELFATNVAYESTPVYLGDTPEKTDPAGAFTYTFREWTPEIVPVTNAATYTAQFDATSADPDKVSVTWVDGNGKTIGTPQLVAKGTEMPVPPADADVPGKDPDADFTYVRDTASPWYPAVGYISVDTTYYAQYTPVPKGADVYAVTWQNANGKVLHTYAVKAGDPVAYTNETPTLAATADYAYKFIGWTADGGATLVDFTGVTAAAAATYTAVYDRYGTPDHPVVFPPEDIADYTNAECVVIRLTNDIGQLTLPAGLTNVVIDLNTFSITGATGTASAKDGETALVIGAADGTVTILGPGHVTGGTGYAANPAGNGGTAVDASGFAGTLLVTNGAYVVGGTGGDATSTSGTGGAGGTGVKIVNADNLTVTDTSWVLGGAAGKNGTPGKGTEPEKDDPRIDDGDLEGSGTKADPYVVYTQAELYEMIARVDVDVTDSDIWVKFLLTGNLTSTTITVPADYANLIFALDGHNLYAADGVAAGENGKDALVLKGNTILEVAGGTTYGIHGGAGAAGASTTGASGGNGGAGIRTPTNYTGRVTLFGAALVWGGNGGDAATGSGGNGGNGGNGIVVPNESVCYTAQNVDDLKVLYGADYETYNIGTGVFGGAAGRGDTANGGTDGEPGTSVGPSDDDGGGDPDDPDPSDNAVDVITPQQFSRNADGTWTLKALFHTSDASVYANADDSAYIVISSTIAGLKDAGNCRKLSALASSGVTLSFADNVLTITDLPSLGGGATAMFVQLRMGPLE